jgi:hypothetical protein
MIPMGAPLGALLANPEPAPISRVPPDNDIINLLIKILNRERVGAPFAERNRIGGRIG